MFDRTIKLIGNDNFNKISSKTVAVVGIGGVGGYAVEGLIRSGIKSIIIVDYDIIDITNLNRQLITDKKHLGYFKVDEMERRILNINPECKVIKIYDKLTKDNLDKLFNYSFDYLIDACDTIVVKEEMIKRCLENNINIISCMGTGNKLDPMAFKVADIELLKELESILKIIILIKNYLLFILKNKILSLKAVFLPWYLYLLQLDFFVLIM